MSVSSADQFGDGSAVCVFHLVWEPFGLGYLERFLASYSAHPAGLPHRLHILFNGFASDEATAAYRASLRSIPHDCTRLDPPVQDINAYLQAARLTTSEYVCFLNSYAAILTAGWLAKLHDHASRASVGLVGATGSYESRLTEAIHSHTPPQLKLGRNLLKWPERARQHRASRTYEREIMRPFEANFPAFPNPHLRTNAFMIRRERLLGLNFSAIRTKEDAYRFESGKTGLTRQVLAAGLDVLIVGRDGKGYRIPDWRLSRTFRSGDQDNLLVSDNQTQLYAEASPEVRRELAAYAWGRGAAAANEAPRAEAPADVGTLTKA